MLIQDLLKSLQRHHNPSNCEYLVFRTDGRSLSTDFAEAEKAKIYEIISILPFPANTNPLYVARIEELTSNIPYSLDTHEKLVIEAALKQVSEDLYVLPIPKSLIGFYIFSTIQLASPYNEKIDVNKFAIGDCSAKAVAAAKKYIKDVMLLLAPQNIARVKAGHANVFKFLDFLVPYLTAKSFADLNKTPGFDQLWHGVNASLIEEINSSSATDLKSMFSLFISRWINDAIKGHHGAVIFGSGFLLSLNEINKGGLNKLLSLELDIAFSSEFENMCVLYRGARGGVEGDLAYLLQSPTNSFSYGNGLLDGLLLSAGDCAFEYMCQGGTVVGIALFVNIANYRRNLQERKLFFIPPLSIISRVLSGQDTSHPKTLGSQLFNSFEESIVPDDMLRLVHAGKVQDNLAPYLQKHAITIYEPKNINLVPQLRSLKLTPTILPDSLLSFLTTNGFSTKAEDIDKINASLHTPLTLAAHKRDLVTAKQLVATGARVDVQNALGNTALHICADTKDHYFAAWLLAVAKVLKLNLAIKNNNAKTPFDLARANGFETLINNEPVLEPKALRFLSRHGFSTLRKDLNSPQDGGKLFTPLIKAAWEKDLDAVIGLVEAGADVSVANSLGNTAAHIAAEKRDLFMYSWLRDHAANLRLANTAGLTAEQMAKQSFKFG